MKPTNHSKKQKSLQKSVGKMSVLLLLLIFYFFEAFATYNCPTQMTKEKIIIPFTGGLHFQFLKLF
jgi:hypothetical protein